MNYNKIYNNIIDRAKNRLIFGYLEKHHIIPKCIGGGDDIDNIVALTPEEHFLCHILLIKIYPEVNDLVFAIHRMCSSSSKNKGRKKRKLYGWLRRKHALAASKRSKGKNNSQYGTIWINNGIVSKKQLKRDKIEIGWKKGRLIKFTPDAKKRIGDTQRKLRKGSKHTDETKEKIRKAALNRYKNNKINKS